MAEILGAIALHSWSVQLWQIGLAQVQSPTLQDLAQEIEGLKGQVEALQATNQVLSNSLTSQIEFLKQGNQALSTSFSQYVDAMRWNLTVLAGLAAILTAVGGWIFKSNLDDAKQMAREMVDRQVEGKISTLVEARVDDVTRTLRREQVIGKTLVDYYLPDGTGPTNELRLLQARGFQSVRPVRSIEAMQSSPGQVAVLDLQNWVLPSGQRFAALPTTEQEAQAQEQIDQLLLLLPRSAVLLIYVTGRINYLNTIRDRYVLAANNPITLVGNAADGAYVAMSDR